MTEKVDTWLQKIKEHPLRSSTIIGAILLGIALLVVIVLGYLFKWDWAGLGPYTPTVTSSNFQRGKTLWDWLQLLVIPLMLGIGGFWFNQVQKSREEKAAQLQVNIERKIATDNQQEVALQTYIDKVSGLLLENQLKQSTPKDEKSNIVRVRTLILLPRLDADRKAYVLLFLYASGLIDKDRCVVDLSRADFRGANLSGVSHTEPDLYGHALSAGRYGGVKLNNANLTGVNMIEANLNGADLRGAELSNAYLSIANLMDADLSEADLSEANLSSADLYMAFLKGVKLCRANLGGTNLSYTHLEGADLTGAILTAASLHEAHLEGADLTEVENKHRIMTREVLEQQTKYLKGAIMPDGSIHP